MRKRKEGEVTLQEAKRRAKGFCKIMLIKAQQNPSKPITEILEEMLIDHALHHCVKP